ncbi:MAG: 6-phosphogluconolactonase [Deltaproteobacteria bacterium]
MISIQEDKASVAAFAASHVAKLIEASAGRFVLALSGGSTPKLFHRVLVEDFAGLPWDRVNVFVSDERAVEPTDENSNVRMARETLVDPLGLKLLAPDGVAANPAKAATAYEAALLGATNGTGAADVVMLGMGDDGHTASLFPDYDPPNGLVAAAQAPKETVAARRLTFTFEAIRRAKEVVVLVAGESKAAALHRVIDERDTALPLTRVFLERNGKVTLIADAAAAKDLVPMGVHR